MFGCVYCTWVDRQGRRSGCYFTGSTLSAGDETGQREMLQLLQLGQRRKTFLPGQRATAVLPAIQRGWIGGVRRGKGAKKWVEFWTQFQPFQLYSLRKIQSATGNEEIKSILLISSLPALWGPTSITSLVPSILLLLTAFSHRASQYHLVS